MNNKSLKLTIGILAFLNAIILTSVIVKIETDPFAYTHRTQIINFSSETKPVLLPTVATEATADVNYFELPEITITPSQTTNTPKTAIKPCVPKYRIIGFADSDFKVFRGVWEDRSNTDQIAE